MQSLCDTCGREHLTRAGRPSCAGHGKHTGDPCPTPPVRGTDKCRMHLGRRTAPVIAEAKARSAMATYGDKIETTATEALIDEVKWTAGHVAWLRDRVAELEEHELVWGTTQIKIGGDDGGHTEAAEPNVLLKLYQQERTHLVRVCSEAIRCGIEERRVRLAEQDGQLVAQAIRGILADLGLTPEQAARIPEIVPRHLRALAG